MTDEAAKLIAAIQALTVQIESLRADLNRPLGPGRGLTTNIRAQDTYTGRTRRMGFWPANAEHEEELNG